MYSVFLKTVKNYKMVVSMDRWVGKVAIVTGGSSGIGAAIAEQLVISGLLVAVLARRDDRVVQLAKQLSGQPGRLYPVKTDITNEEQILKAFEWVENNLGPVHVLVNNAGVFLPGYLHNSSTEDWDNTFKVNVLGLSIATREAIKSMMKNNVDGHIIDINSLAGHQVPPNIKLNAYAASKFAVTALAETLRNELNLLKSKIKVTSISPGLVHTDIIPDQIKNSSHFGEILQEKHILEPQDIADAVIFALSTPTHVQIQELTITAVIQEF